MILTIFANLIKFVLESFVKSQELGDLNYLAYGNRLVVIHMDSVNDQNQLTYFTLTSTNWLPVQSDFIPIADSEYNNQIPAHEPLVEA